MKFCVKCGNSIREGAFCTTCQRIDEKVLELSIPMCSCESVIWQNRWQKKALKTLLEKKYVCKIEESLPIVSKRQETHELILQKNNQKTQLMLTLTPQTCPTCQQQRTEYFEGVLQIRTTNQSVMDKAFAFVQGYLAKKDFHVTRVAEQKNGVDLYVTDKRKMNNMAHKIRNQFGGIISANPQLFSRNSQTSKDIYRLNVLIELPHFDKGDVIIWHGEPVLVTTLATISGTSLATGKRVKITYAKDLPILQVHKTTISHIQPLEAIHPETYQSEPIQNKPTKKYSLGEKIKVVIHNKGLYLLDA
ncbi:MAG: NMD3-related protein [Nanoarchaeota archaeon]